MKKYLVTLKVTREVDVEIEIEADSERDAEKRAIDDGEYISESDGMTVDWEIRNCEELEGEEE